MDRTLILAGAGGAVMMGLLSYDGSILTGLSPQALFISVVASIATVAAVLFARRALFTDRDRR